LKQPTKRGNDKVPNAGSNMSSVENKGAITRRLAGIASALATQHRRGLPDRDTLSRMSPIRRDSHGTEADDQIIAEPVIIYYLVTCSAQW